MIIDLIMDRYDGEMYNAREFYYNVMQYGGRDAERITAAMDFGSETDVRAELCCYVIRNDYADWICGYICGQMWL